MTAEPPPVFARLPRLTAASAARLAALEDAFAPEIEQRAALEARVAELAAELEALGERRTRLLARATSTTAPPTSGRHRAGASACSRQWRRLA